VPAHARHRQVSRVPGFENARLGWIELDGLYKNLDWNHRVGRLTEVVPVRRVEPVPEHVSSDPGPDGATPKLPVRHHLA
jgi:hypothetical protein